MQLKRDAIGNKDILSKGTNDKNGSAKIITIDTIRQFRETQG